MNNTSLLCLTIIWNSAAANECVQSIKNVRIYFRCSKAGAFLQCRLLGGFGERCGSISPVQESDECCFPAYAGGQEMMRHISPYYYPTSRYRACKGNYILRTRWVFVLKQLKSTLSFRFAVAFIHPLNTKKYLIISIWLIANWVIRLLFTE